MSTREMYQDEMIEKVEKLSAERDLLRAGLSEALDIASTPDGWRVFGDRITELRKLVTP